MAQALEAQGTCRFGGVRRAAQGIGTVRLALGATALPVVVAVAAVTALDGICLLAFGAAAASCLWRGRLGSVAGVAWLLQGLAIASYLGGELYSRHLGADAPLPSPADALWLSFYVLSYASVILHARSRMRSRAPHIWIDGIIVGLAGGAVATAAAFGTLRPSMVGDAAAVATGLAYPIADLVLLVLIICALEVAPTRTWSSRLQLGGLSAYLAADVLYLVAQAHGTWHRDPGIRLLWIGGVCLMGLSALIWTPPVRRDTEAPEIVVPLAATAMAMLLLVYGQWSVLPLVAIALALATVLLALIRVVLAVEEIRRLARVEHGARHDTLTGLANRHVLVERLAESLQAIGAGGPSVLFLDIDDFSDVNQELGFEAANGILRTIADRLLAMAGTGWFSARIGGDEFAVLLPAGADAQAAADLIRAEVGRPMPDLGFPFAVTAVVGIATSPSHGATAVDVIASADLAVHQARRSRSGVATFRPEPGGPGPGRRTLRAEIRDALGAGQITAHLQPQVDLRRGRIVGVEALARWDHPVRGLIPPGVFLDLVADTGLMAQLTGHMIEQAVGALSHCSERGHPVGVSVNISALDLAGDDLVRCLERALGQVRGQVGKLTIEITEDAVLVDRERAINALTRIRELGVRVSVDDYGTGQSSLSYVRDLPLDELKLDRSFVMGGAGDPRRSAIVRSTVELAHSLALTAVAEGIEDAETAVWLRGLGCDVGQGFHFARPVPLGDLLPLLDRDADAIGVLSA